MKPSPMNSASTATNFSHTELDLTLTRVIAASPAHAFATWTGRFKEWWGPHGMTTPFCEMDLRPGGEFRTVMRAPDGTDYPTRGVFLAVVPGERIVFTDAFDPDWRPHADIFFTGDTTFERLPDGRTQLTARARHWTVEARRQHEAMGFEHGWGECLERLAALCEQA